MVILSPSYDLRQGKKCTVRARLRAGGERVQRASDPPPTDGLCSFCLAIGQEAPRAEWSILRSVDEVEGRREGVDQARRGRTSKSPGPPRYRQRPIRSLVKRLGPRAQEAQATRAGHPKPQKQEWPREGPLRGSAGIVDHKAVSTSRPPLDGL